MAVCVNCGAPNPDDAKFCPQCGTPLQSPRARETRKTVTILFCDLTGSTQLGEQLDSESVRSLLASYFQAMRTAIEGHGGTIEKFIGDAVMAVFGTPVVHEDDALRAARAALEMREALGELNDELGARWSTTLETRTGINTGEVVAGSTAEGLGMATGDAVNVAARLEQAAQPGEILIGPETHRLVRGVMSCEPVTPLDLKGKSEPVPAFRLLEEAARLDEQSTRRAPLVGRERELTALTDALERAVEGARLEMVTVVGTAGVGKSRLKTEFLAQASRATVLEGTCLPYGRGITFWPIAQIARQAAGITEGDSPDEARAKLVGLMAGGSEAVGTAERIATLMGLTDDAAAEEELAWAAQRLLETVAGSGPLVVVLDDLHWGEETLMSLVERVAAQSAAEPILLLCLARPELRDVGPALLSEGPNREVITLESLGPEDSRRMIEEILGAASLEPEVAERIAGNAQGNPLFVEEFVRMLVDEGAFELVGGRWVWSAGMTEMPVPPTIGALLGARLDRLEPAERDVTERAAVIGQEFWRSAVEELASGSPPDQVSNSLEALARRTLIEPADDPLGSEDAFRFRHILIRDAAYRAALKTLRAELHERFAGWLERKVEARLNEYEEVVGYHLEQAHRLRTELSPADETTRALGRRAASHLAAAGRRALARSDMPAAVNLLERSAELLPGTTADGSPDPERAEVELSLCDALLETDLDRADELLGSSEAQASPDARLRARSLVMRSFCDLRKGEIDLKDERLPAEIADAIEVFDEQADHTGAAQAFRLLADLQMHQGHYGLAIGDLERALSHAQRGGDAREVSIDLTFLASALIWGPAHTAEALERCQELLDQAEGRRLIEAKTKLILAGLEAMTGQFGPARPLYAEGVQALDEMGVHVPVSTSKEISGMIEMLAGNYERAEAEYRAGYERLRGMGEASFLPSMAAGLARALMEQGRIHDAEELMRDADRTEAEDELAQADRDTVHARLASERGDHDRAVALAKGAVAVYAATDELQTHADALVDLAKVLAAAGSTEAAAGALRDACRLYEAKGVEPALARTRATLSRLETSRPA